MLSSKMRICGQYHALKQSLSSVLKSLFSTSTIRTFPHGGEIVYKCQKAFQIRVFESLSCVFPCVFSQTVNIIPLWTVLWIRYKHFIHTFILWKTVENSQKCLCHRHSCMFRKWNVENSYVFYPKMWKTFAIMTLHFR